MRLAGRRIVVCRAVDRAGPLLDAIESEGGQAIHVPLIEVVPPLDGGAALRAALAWADRSTWVVATSANGVDAIVHALATDSSPTSSPVVGLESSALEPVRPWRLAVVGRATAAQALAWTLAVDFESPEASAAGLARSLPVGAGERVIAAVAELAGPDLEGILRQRGINVEMVTAYRTVAPEVTPADRQRILDADLVFATSPSVVQRLQSSIGRADLPPMVAIGRTTAAAVEEAGLALSATAADPSVDGLIDAAVRSLLP